MRRYKSFIDIEKEEKWLNEQLQKGYRCKAISGLGIYTFEKTNKKYVIRLDYQDYLSRKRFMEYKGIYEDFGWFYIKGSPFGGKHYWQKEEGNQNEIFSDRQSTNYYYKRLMNYSLTFAIMSLAFAYLILKDSGLYLTEGLWNMEGSLFWKAFLFETPFALLRLLPVIGFIFFGIGFYKAYRKYSLSKDK